MEDLRDRYEEPDDPKRPCVCVDERPCPWLGDGQEPWPLVPGAPERFDDAYTRHGTCHLFIIVEPLPGGRHLRVTTRRPKRECAQGLAALVDGHVPAAEKMRVVWDNLKTHTPGALYEGLAPAEARRILRKLALHRPPVPGSWRTRAESEFAVLARQCLNRRLRATAMMPRETAAWQQRRHRSQATIDWRFTTDDARIKLQSLYPKESR
jgi:hypothetical protein